MTVTKTLVFSVCATMVLSKMNYCKVCQFGDRFCQMGSVAARWLFLHADQHARLLLNEIGNAFDGLGFFCQRGFSIELEQSVVVGLILKTLPKLRANSKLWYVDIVDSKICGQFSKSRLMKSIASGYGVHAYVKELCNAVFHQSV